LRRPEEMGRAGEVLLGIDEAGRGPLIGPMVVAAVALEEGAIEELVKAGVRDSKKLRRSARERLAPLIVERSLLTLAITLSPRDLDRSNINTLEISAVKKILGSVVSILGSCPRTYVDLFAPRNRISELYAICPDIVAEHGADARYPVVGAASIVAKVLRDWYVEKLRELIGDFGSGYPSDPKTREWFSRAGGEAMELIAPFIRYKWATLARLGVAVNTLDRYIIDG